MRTWRKLTASLVVVAGALIGAPAAQASLAWDAGSFNFGNQNVGTTSAHTFTLTANCDAPIDPMLLICLSPAHPFGPVTVSGEGFALSTPNSCLIGTLVTPTFPGQMTCQTAVSFTPSTPGLKTGTLNTSGPDISLSGTGVSPTTPITPTTQTPATGGVAGQAKKKCKKKKRGAAAAKKCKKKRK